MGDANCPECGGGYEVSGELVMDGEILTATCHNCQTEFDVEASVSFNMAMAGAHTV